MLESLTGDDIYATVVMMKAADARAVVVLEGPNDCNCLGPHISPDTAETLPAHGAANLDRVLELLEANGLDGVLIIRDRDWHGISDPLIQSPHLVYTDLYDLDATIMCGVDTGDRVALVFGGPASVRSHCESTGLATPVAAAVAIAREIGLVRLVSHETQAGLALRNFPIRVVSDPQTASVRQGDLISLAISRTKGTAISAEDLRAQVEMMRARSIPDARLCSGHDLVAALAMLIRHAWHGSEVGAGVLEQTMRSALACADLHRLSLFGEVRAWEERTGHHVWHCGPTGEAA